jgi:hypothetical protein
MHGRGAERKKASASFLKKEAKSVRFRRVGTCQARARRSKVFFASFLFTKKKALS